MKRTRLSRSDVTALHVDRVHELLALASTEAERVTIARDLEGVWPVIARFDAALVEQLAQLAKGEEAADDLIRRLVWEATQGRTGAAGVELVEDPLVWEKQAPRWPSTLADVDRIAGGFYGVTVIAGETGVGKSSLAFASALEAALGGWTVVYCNAELDAGTVRSYIKRWLPQKALRDAALLNLRVVNVGPGVTLPLLAQRMEGALDWSYKPHERLLVVLDSVNTIAELAQGGEGVETYFAELRRWLLWVMDARRRSSGVVSALVISETNAKGETKGRKADYVADMVVNLRRGDMDGYVKAAVVKGRYSGRQDLGALYFDHNTGQFKGATVEYAPAAQESPY
jgi:predicted ATP-dependent serine protease